MADGYDSVVAEVISEIKAQLRMQNGRGRVWIKDWHARFGKLGSLRAFLESRRDKFQVIPGPDLSFIVELVESNKIKGGFDSSYLGYDPVVANAITEIKAQLREQNGHGQVWIDDWNVRFGQLGTLREFLESRPDKFQVVPTSQRGFEVMLVRTPFSKGGDWGKGPPMSKGSDYGYDYDRFNLFATKGDWGKGPPMSRDSDYGYDNDRFSLSAARGDWGKDPPMSKGSDYGYDNDRFNLSAARGDWGKGPPMSRDSDYGYDNDRFSLSAARGDWGKGMPPGKGPDYGYDDYMYEDFDAYNHVDYGGGYDPLVAAAITEIKSQLREQGGYGTVWVDLWSERFSALGTLRQFLESRPDKFDVYPGHGRGFTVALAGRVPSREYAQKERRRTEMVARKGNEYRAENDGYDPSVAMAITELKSQLREQNGEGKVFIDDWKDRFKHLGSMRGFMESRPDKFEVIPGRGRAFTVRLVTKPAGKGSAKKEAAQGKETPSWKPKLKPPEE